MPRENRKRGKKNKKKVLDDESEPSWIVHNPENNQRNTEQDLLEAPFGYVDADVKTYFRAVDAKMRNWQDHTHKNSDALEGDPNEDRRLFFVAALSEMAGKEKQLATDPDCSVILERMAHSMDDFARRVFVDSLCGSYEVLARHRFASHVCQTLFAVASQTIGRESYGILPAVPESSEKGELRTITQLVVDISEELRPKICSLIMDPFASHVVRTLLSLLSPNLSASIHADSQTALRSKKSAAWKARQGPMTSVFTEHTSKQPMAKTTPAEFHGSSRKIIQIVRETLGDNEVRALAADKVASPGLQVLLEVEASQKMSEEPGSLLDSVTVGLITSYRANASLIPEPSDYLNTLLRDPTSSHLLEIIIRCSPDDVFSLLWTVYFQGKLARLAIHPVANFVVARALERVAADQLVAISAELQDIWDKLIKTSRTGVLRALIERASTLHVFEEDACKATLSAFQLTSEDQEFLVHCILHLMSAQHWRQMSEGSQFQTDSAPLVYTVQGALILQSLLRLSAPHNKIVIDSICSLSIDDRIKIAHDATGSRIFDAFLESETIPKHVKQRFVMDFIGHYHFCRVGDRCWFFADTYMKEKIGRSLIPFEHVLAGSYYGKFFARNINLYLLQRRPQEWRDMQAKTKSGGQTTHPPHTPPVEKAPRQASAGENLPKRKRPAPANEIDELFNASLGKKMKKAALAADDPPLFVIQNSRTTKKADDLQDVLGAIRAAPKTEKVHKKRKVKDKIS
ncbi:armadillo-type protein [Infundibulicybe gibba]|nr:armadillo-type protein [Infundibulicybe gibba]